jgi:hypothetical protein
VRVGRGRRVCRAEVLSQALLPERVDVHSRNEM